MRFWSITRLFFLSVCIFSQTAVGNQPCVSCHARLDLTKVTAAGDTVSLYVDPQQVSRSEHSGLMCVDCHQDLRGKNQRPHPAPVKPVDCAHCHIAEGQQVAISPHWRISISGQPQALTCATCHSSHDVLKSTNPTSRTHRKSITKICLDCHTQQDQKSDTLVTAYKFSVHGQRNLVQGDTAAAECVDCHSNHNIQPTDNPTSPVYKPKIPATCGKCHATVLAEYQTSIHGQAIALNILDAPVCTDCHGEHTIQRPDSTRSRISAEHIPETCGRCHESVQLTEKYKLPGERFSTYQDSYHGVANQYGKTIVANCASCHGYHHILPAGDPNSTIHPNNLPKTCGQCHPNAGQNFALGKMHVKATFENSPGVFFVRKFYYIFIGALMLLFLLYMIIDYYGFKRRRKTQEKP